MNERFLFHGIHFTSVFVFFFGECNEFRQTKFQSLKSKFRFTNISHFWHSNRQLATGCIFGCLPSIDFQLTQNRNDSDYIDFPIDVLLIYDSYDLAITISTRKNNLQFFQFISADSVTIRKRSETQHHLHTSKKPLNN